MTLPELSIKRHVFAYMMSAVLVLFGIISYQRIGMDRFPHIEFPIVSISTTQKGANPEIIDASITNRDRNGRSTACPGIEHIQSTSSPGVSIVAITFSLDKDVDIAFNEVQAKVNQVLSSLPKDADPPVVAKVETNARPIMWLALQRRPHPAAAQPVRPQHHQETPGNHRRRRRSAPRRAPRPHHPGQHPSGQMAALNITAQDLIAAFASEHIQHARRFRGRREDRKPAQAGSGIPPASTSWAKLIVAYRDGAPVRLYRISPKSRTVWPITARWPVSRASPPSASASSRLPTATPWRSIERGAEAPRQRNHSATAARHDLKLASNDAIFIKEMVKSLQGASDRGHAAGLSGRAGFPARACAPP